MEADGKGAVVDPINVECDTERKAEGGNGTTSASESSAISSSPNETNTEQSAVAAKPQNTLPSSSHRLPPDEIRTSSLGTLHVLPDRIIMDIFGTFDAMELCTASLVSKVFYIFAEEDEHWKSICLTKFRGSFVYKGCWKRTVLMPKHKPVPEAPYKKLPITGFYSDLFYARWYRSHCPLTPWQTLPPDLPPQLQVDRRSNLSVEEFVEEYAKKNRPVILTDVVTKWPAWINKSWTREALSKRFGNTLFRVDQTDDEGDKLHMKLKNYFEYAATNTDEDPIYVFCPYYGDRAPALLSDYEIPPHFTEDFLPLLGEKRPSYRWVVIGSQRSGSAFHLDPFKTSAWNALLSGRKRWALYPPGIYPPGLDWDQDDNGKWDYTGEDPVKWYLHHYPAASTNPNIYLRPIECIQEAGDLIYVPSNWWHAVFNIEEAIAVTQNFCDTHCFEAVYEDMKWDNDNYYLHVYFTEQMLRVRPDLMKLSMIHPGFWTRQSALNEKKARKEYRKEKQRLTQETEQMEKWAQGISDPDMRRDFQEKSVEPYRTHVREHLAQLKKRRQGFLHPNVVATAQQHADTNVFDSNNNNHSNNNNTADGSQQSTTATTKTEFTAAVFWRQPLPQLDESDFALLTTTTTTTTTATTPTITTTVVTTSTPLVVPELSNEPGNDNLATASRSDNCGPSFNDANFWRMPLPVLEELTIP
eukprot:TRINITY_DN698_c0_g1_i3.p1 TRINITY_DN698_c0_g1~~TRINITY_DN698_c0_g1_i3.p1  ORF type:complete len:697 (-),score=118.00 TRINITY_DN698_c0_g1_i3:17-2107(-)